MQATAAKFLGVMQKKARQRDAQDPNVALCDSRVPLLALADLCESRTCFQPANLPGTPASAGKQQPSDNLF